MGYKELQPYVRLGKRLRDCEEFFDRFDKLVVSYSGGKDSTATLLWCLTQFPKDRIDAVFCDTGAEWPETYEYVNYVELSLKVKINQISGPKDLFELTDQRGKWPGARFRWCTRELKTKPLRRYLLDRYQYPLVLFGQRWAESAVRSRLPFLTPHVERLGFPVLRPILDWDEKQVWEIHRRKRLKRNPVYKMTNRASCWCCIMAPFEELVKFGMTHRSALEERAKWEQRLGHHWKSPRLSLVNALQVVQSADQSAAPVEYARDYAEAAGCNAERGSKGTCICSFS